MANEKREVVNGTEGKGREGKGRVAEGREGEGEGDTVYGVRVAPTKALRERIS